jgi:hypothetical protein
MNLHELDPKFFADEEIHLNLAAIYSEHERHTHQRGLEAVFIEGYHYALDYPMPKPELQQELDNLRDEFNALQQKYDALNAKFNINQPAVDPILADEMQTKVISQVLGMGDVFRCGRTV